MKRRTCILGALLIGLNFLFAQGEFEVGVILVQVRQPETVSIVGAQALNGSAELSTTLVNAGLRSSRKLSRVNYDTDGWYRLEFPLEAQLETIRQSLLKCPDIRYATFNGYGTVAGTPNDPRWNDQWALQLLGVTQAWDIAKPNGAILVGVMDTGIDYAHPELSANMWPGIGEDYVDGEDPQEGPGQSHGTRVSGVIAARTYNAIGLAGIAGGWQGQNGVKLIALRIVDPTFGEWTAERAKYAIDFLTSLRQQGNTVIANMSIQTDLSDDGLIVFKQSVDAARNAGVILVAAAGWSLPLH